jgi:hypothetical protein
MRPREAHQAGSRALDFRETQKIILLANLVFEDCAVVATHSSVWVHRPS